MALTDTERAQAATDDTPPAIESRLGAWWVIAGLALLLLVILGWKFMADPSISAPTRDPAWYTWRANVILQSNPVTVAQEWGPAGLFSGGTGSRCRSRERCCSACPAWTSTASARSS